jgi:hypothetical protein
MLEEQASMRVCMPIRTLGFELTLLTHVPLWLPRADKRAKTTPVHVPACLFVCLLACLPVCLLTYVAVHDGTGGLLADPTQLCLERSVLVHAKHHQ